MDPRFYRIIACVQFVVATVAAAVLILILGTGFYLSWPVPIGSILDAMILPGMIFALGLSLKWMIDKRWG